MANFDSNQWYHIYYDEDNGTALMGGVLFKQETHSGASFFQAFNETNPAHLWQFYLVENNPDYYALRTKDSGSEGFLGTMYSADEDTPGKTKPRMIRGDLSDDSVYWRVSPWDDGTFYLSNKANSTDYHLTRKSSSLGVMTSNITGDKPFQHFSFDALSAINDENFSTVHLPSATATFTSTSSSSTASSSNTATSTSTDHPSSGISTGAKAGIGAGVGIVVIILVIVGGLFMWKRSRRTQTPPADPVRDSDKYTTDSASAEIYELPRDTAVNYEVYGTPKAELYVDAQPVELAGESQGQNHAR